MKYTRTLSIAALIAVLTAVSLAQTSGRDVAIKYFLAGNYLEAILAFEELIKDKKYASDAEVVNYLGLAYQNALDEKKARKMFEKAVKLAPDSAVYRANLAYSYLMVRQLNRSQSQAKKALQLDPGSVPAYFVLGTADLWEKKPQEAMKSAEKMIEADAGNSLGYILKSDVLTALLGIKVSTGAEVKDEMDLLRQSVEVLETGLSRSTGKAGRTGIEQKLEVARAFYDYFTKDRSVPPVTGAAPEPGVTPLKIISNPRASYTESARSAGVQGSILIAVLLGADGGVHNVMKMKGLGYGLDEQAIKAASRIVFQPRIKDGVAVSTVKLMEYTFSIY